ncbi:polyketide synthase [Lentzea sp. NBRC 105346]|uniref:type I polyketide synthase n=1 Tax=Lentzea sp. NBRC 105346 TaxID=3032205 RepID=UPI0024A5BC40|nr:type I polyketide synthase [Lentzea sp. NBRC 105346]GLZ35964.1 polyketide synthase [Lentzea sp. NBRC 105346]
MGEVLGITPSARVAATLCAAGAVGVLDLGAGDRNAVRELRRAARSIDGTFGVRVGAATAEVLPDQVSLVVTDTVGEWRAAGRRVVVEVADVAAARAAVCAGADGLLVKGDETSELTSFVLLQYVLSEVDVPVWVAGGIGPWTAAAAVAGGAAGVVLDSPDAGAVRAVRDAIAAARRPEIVSTLAEGSPLAQRLGCRLPVAQGPMTRVSDRPELALAVAGAGGMPFLALALADEAATTALLRETSKSLGEKPWGVGILGFAPEEVRAAQLDAIRRERPAAVIIAGGRPTQASALEADGIPAFLHVPSPRLLGQFLDAGARRFVFEGAECGGHIGPKSSFRLWQEQVDVLVGFLDARPGTVVDVFFAGGVHDSRSAAMVAALAAPLTTRGAGVGVLMGTAYLFTAEAVTSGAIGAAFQRQVLAAATTAVLETAPGHQTRCVTSPFADEFTALRAELREQGVPDREAWERLEQLNIGRLRIASKGLRRAGDALVEVDEATQVAEGLFMAGQVAVLRDTVTTVAELHADVTAGATEVLARNVIEDDDAFVAPPLDIAIIGMAGVFPGATDTAAFWANVLDGVDAVTEVPAHRWDPALHHPGRVPSKWGGFLPEIGFDPLRYGIPPASLASIEPVQLVALEVTARAIADAGYADRSFDRSRTAVVFGAESGGEHSNAVMLRAMLPGYLAEVPTELDEQLPAFTEDTFPGVLANVISGRIANRLDLGGANFTVDAACASSLAALHVACRELTSGSADLALAGGADTHNGLYDYQLFGAVGALSPTGRSRAFDASADGIALSEGVGCVVLKRLADAERDGDRVYAVIRGIGTSSDGRSLGLTAPRPDGQRAAITRAYANARVTPADVGIVEAHGTGTAVGDRTELATLTEMFAGTAPGGTVLGSVKSQIGHTKCAAGLAGLIKTAMALHTGTRPPTAHLTRPVEPWSADDSPFAFHTSAAPWPGVASDRVAGISGFGFGGTNFHAVLTGHGGPSPRHGRDQWPAELFVFRAQSDVDWLRTLVDARPDARLRDLALTAARRFERTEARAGAAFVARDVAELTRKLADVTISEPRPLGEVALLFPGQGSQRPGMAAELLVAFPELQELADRPWAGVLFPPAAFTEEQARRQQDRLRDTRIAQPALGVAGLAYHHVLTTAGVRPDMAAGHSYGELVALTAAGALDPDDLVGLSEARAAEILAATGDDPGAMAAVTAPPAEVEPLLTGGVVIANHNSPRQTVISGPTADVERTVEALSAAGLRVKPIPVACAFHSPLVADAGPRFAARVAELELAAPLFPVWANRTASEYPADADVAVELGAQIGAPVRFAEQIEAMYAAGARVFVECGPGTVLSGLVDAVLGDRPHQTVHMERSGGGLTGVLTALAELAAAGVPIRPSGLCDGRAADLTDTVAKRPQWTVDGQAVRTAAGEFVSGRPPKRVTLTRTARGGDPDAVIDDYLRTTREFVNAQRDIMLAYFGAEQRPLPRAESVPAPVEPVVVESQQEEPVGSTLDVVTSLISERTGYPVEMIEPGLDLEADLSIDSIKRTELVGELAARFAGRVGDADIEELAKARSAGALAESLDRRLGGAAESKPVVRVETPSGVAPTRFVLTEVVAEAEPTGELTGRRLAVTGADTPFGAAVATALVERGVVLDPDGPDGLVYLDALAPAGAEDDPMLLPELFPRLRAAALTGGTLLVVVRDGDRRAAGLRGFMRSVFRECPQATIKLVELTGEPDPDLVCAELLSRGEPVVRLGERRSAFTLTAAPLGLLGTAGGGPDGQGGAEAAALGLGRESVLVLVGGARGITARFAETAAAASGCRIVLAGRTDLAGDPEPAEVAAAADLAGIRAALAALGTREPTELDRLARRVLARREVNATLTRLRGLGSDVRYWTLDATDTAAVRTLVKQTHAEFGRVDGVVFAAGVIEDRLLADKTVDSFRRVFGTKVDGASALLAALADLPDAPSFTVLFGSIAAVLGNRGQCDYAAANDALETLGREFAARSGSRALTVHWGPWAPDAEHGGMVTPELAVDYARRGIELIDPEEGAVGLLRELAWGAQDCVVYTASGW